MKKRYWLRGGLLGVLIGFAIPIVMSYVFKIDTYFTLLDTTSDSSILIVPFMIIERFIYGAIIGWLYGKISALGGSASGGKNRHSVISDK